MSVISRLIPSWGKKHDAHEQETASVAPSTELAPSAAKSPDDQGTRTVVTLDADRLVDKIASVVEVAIRKNNRRRFLWRLGRYALVALILGALASMFTSGELGSTKMRIKKEVIATLPVAGAVVPQAASTAHIAVIKVTGAIDGDLFGPAVEANTTLYLATALATANADQDLAGVVLYINSPGGSAAASAWNYRLVKRFRERLAKRNIPIIAYVADGAYSGGYYTALGASTIVVDPEATVANIGVIMHLFNTAGLGHLLGIKENVIATGPLKSTGSQWEDLTPAQRKMVVQSMQSPFHHFLAAVSESRKIPLATLEAGVLTDDGDANGGWFSAEDALPRHLVDQIIPVEDLFAVLANTLPDKTKYNSVEFVDLQKKLSATERLSSGVGHLGSTFFGGMFQELKRANETQIRAE